MSGTSRFYLRGLAFRHQPDSGEHSSVLPTGTSAGAFSGYAALFADTGSAASSFSRSSLAQTAHQDGAIAGFTSQGLAAQTIGAGTWTLAAQLKESSSSANAFAVLSVYAWRPSTSAVVGYIYDSDTTLGNEWGTGANGTGQVLTFSGSSLDVEAEDLLVVEVWFHATQADATSRTDELFYDGATDVTAGYTGADPATYLEPPVPIAVYDGLILLNVASATAASFPASISASYGALTLEEGTLLVAVVEGLGSNSSDYPLPSSDSGVITGWTYLMSSVYNVNGLDRNVKVYYKLRGSGETATTARFAAGNNQANLHILAWSGADQTTPIADYSIQTNSHASGTSITAASIDAPITVSPYYSQLLGVFAHSLTSGTASATPPTGMVEEGDNNVNSQGLEVASQAIVGEGATGTRSATAGTAHTDCAAGLLVITPAVVSPMDGYWAVLLS